MMELVSFAEREAVYDLAERGARWVKVDGRKVVFTLRPLQAPVQDRGYIE